MRKALTLLFLSILTSVCALAFASALTPATAEATIRPTTAERRVIAAINREREARGLAKVRFKASLTRAARYQARDMAARHVLSHVSGNGWTIGQRARHFGYGRSGFRSWSVGETIACGQRGTLYATPKVIVALWMGSPAHRDILLTARFRDIGVGICASGDGMRYFTVDLGRRVR